jgi:hypothetical protein
VDAVRADAARQLVGVGVVVVDGLRRRAVALLAEDDVLAGAGQQCVAEVAAVHAVVAAEAVQGVV